MTFEEGNSADKEGNCADKEGNGADKDGNGADKEEGNSADKDPKGESDEESSGLKINIRKAGGFLFINSTLPPEVLLTAELFPELTGGAGL